MDIHSLFLILHVLGVAIGAGGAFTSDYLFINSLRDDKKISATELRLLHAAGRVVWAGIAVLITSGVVLLWLDNFTLLSSSAFLAKMTIVGVLIGNGFVFHWFHLPFLQRLWRGGEIINTESSRWKAKFVFASGAISSVSWLFAIFLGYMRVLPYSYLAIIAFYIGILVFAIGIALFIKQFLLPLRIASKKETETQEKKWHITISVFLAAAVIFSGLAYLNTLGFDTAKKRVDTSVTLTPKAELALAKTNEDHTAYAPNVPPPIERGEQKLFEVHIEVIEEVCEIDPKTGARFETWGYRIAGDDEVVCGSPGPVIRGRVGDVARITLTNLVENKEHHDIDFHAVTGPGGGAKALSVAPGETATVEVRLLYPGVFMYHCAHEDPPKHIAHGMYGMFIVDPEQPLPTTDHEWAVMQSEWYLANNQNEIAELDTAALRDETPSHFTFNGTTQALTGEGALQMGVGERARIYFVNQGLNLNSNFHPIGSHWDIVYPEGATHPANTQIYGSQSTLVVAGGGSVVELVARVPGDIILVDHALSRAFYKGALGIIKVSGQENTEIIEAMTTQEHEHNHETQDESDAKGEVQSFSIEAGNYYYSLDEIRVKKGDTVRISVENAQGFHDFVIDEFNIATERLQSGESETIEFVADKAGEFEYYCSVGRHRELGQWGTLIVEE